MKRNVKLSVKGFVLTLCIAVSLATCGSIVYGGGGGEVGPFAAITRITDNMGTFLRLEADGAMSVALQDQHSSVLLLPMVHEIAASSITADTVIDAYDIDVASTTSFVVGQHFRIINAAADRYYYGGILAINSLTITLDTPFDFVYASGSEVTVSSTNMNVDGSTTPVVFKLRTGAPSIPSRVDITRLIIVCESPTAVDLSNFCGQAALTRGLVFRSVNGTQSNIFNIKSSKDIAGLDYDWTPFSATNPQQGADGWLTRLTFAGQNKIGVVLRVESDGNLEMLVQDNLTAATTLTTFLEGHIVE